MSILSKIKTSDRTDEDGRTTLRSIRQYSSLTEIYQSFGEAFIGEDDFHKRILEFEQRMQNETNS